MRKVYVVSYDVSDPKRLRKVYQLMLGWGEHIQLSVFQCELTARELIELRTELSSRIDHDQDQVLFVDVGPVDGRGSTSIKALGRPHVVEERRAVVV